MGRVTSALLACLIVTLGASSSSALDYPNRYVRIIVPYAPGGSAEAQARTLAERLSDLWKQQVIVENKPGAGTTVGAAFVARAPADGYTLYLAGTSHTISPSLYRDLKYDPVQSFAPISRVSNSPFLLLVTPALHVDTVQQLIDKAKEKPGALNYSTSGIGAGPHLSAEMFIADTGIKVRHVPYAGSAPAMAALLGHFVDFGMGDVSSLPTVQAGMLQALAVTTNQRSSQLPNVPTMAEALHQDYEVTNWSAILAPAGTPADIVQFINRSIAKALAAPEIKKAFEAQGFEPAPSTSKDLEEFMKSEVTKYAQVLKRAGVAAR